MYSTLLRIPDIYKICQIHQFATYLDSVYQDYIRFGFEEDESIILQNCQSFLYTSKANAKVRFVRKVIRSNVYNLFNNFSKLRVMSSIQCLYLNFAKTILSDNQLSFFLSFIDDSPHSFNSSSDSLTYKF
ncbi:6689_t:CDS:1, partial [Racocetra persica]